MANIKIYFKITTRKELFEFNIEELISFRPSRVHLKNSKIILKGVDTGRIRNESNWNYHTEYVDINDTNDCLKDWIGKWQQFKPQLLKLYASDFHFELLQEITIIDGKFPAIYINHDLVQNLAEMKIDLSWYFYNE